MKAVVLISGGLDSTTCLAIARERGLDCYTLSFDYGQRHRAELQAAARIAHHFGAVRHEVISLNVGKLGGSALTDPALDVPDHTDDTSIPITYVPARNTTFLAIALGYAEIVEAQHIFIGVSAIDYSNYPDCRPEYIEAFQAMANLATRAGVEGRPITIETPLLYLSKAETIALGQRLGVDYAMTVSCYQATPDGLACGRCASCTLRERGFAEANVADPTHYRRGCHESCSHSNDLDHERHG